MMKLEIKNLHAEINNQEILKGINLELRQGEVHALMGKNGSGKSTLANVLMGNKKYTITQGSILLDGKDITNLEVDERAKLGLFLSFQYPSEIAGLTLSSFLRTAYNSVNKEKLDVLKFHNLLKKKMEELNIPYEFIKRHVNEGFSGGEKKRSEILQMAILQPKYAILDETDSGLDINAIKTIGEGVNKMRNENRGILIITHYHRILNYITPDRVSILSDGKITQTGTGELARHIEEHGFKEIENAQ
ncbi:MAG TPA: Fe-S cluster assembly ATPase SufC [Candidatus Nanoarchaeia archaeon]|nr:Fe-S cluster assembly ATPase SufC [Candidatus Nanoarchaeia archaeon]